MEQLKQYLFALSMQERLLFAKRCKTSYPFLRNVAYGQKRPGETLAILIEKESAGRIPCEVTRPDVPWHVLRTSRRPKPQTKTPQEAA